MNITANASTAAVAALVLLAGATPATSPGAGDPILAAETQDVKRSIAYFRPEHLEPATLSSAVRMLVLSGGALGDIRQGADMYEPLNIQVVENMLVVSALPDLLPDVVALMNDLDAQSAAMSGDAADADSVTTFQYQLRFASRTAVHEALTPFRNKSPQQVQTGGDPTGITIVPETGTVVVRETRAIIEEIRSVLEEIDQPQPQVRLTYYLVRGYSEESMADHGYEHEDMNQGLPEGLVGDLGALLPLAGFRAESFGVLQGNALARREFRDSLPDANIQLRMYPTTFDRWTGTLGVDQIDFSYQSNRGSQGTKSFTTSAQLTPGRYTVLGGVGAEPLFVVLQMTRM